LDYLPYTYLFQEVEFNGSVEKAKGHQPVAIGLFHKRRQLPEITR
jgi:hypothetical protein